MPSDHDDFHALSRGSRCEGPGADLVSDREVGEHRVRAEDYEVGGPGRLSSRTVGNHPSGEAGLAEFPSEQTPLASGQALEDGDPTGAASSGEGGEHEQDGRTSTDRDDLPSSGESTPTRTEEPGSLAPETLLFPTKPGPDAGERIPTRPRRKLSELARPSQKRSHRGLRCLQDSGGPPEPSGELGFREGGELPDPASQLVEGFHRKRARSVDPVRSNAPKRLLEESEGANLSHGPRSRHAVCRREPSLY